jgi:hypothetical protein
MLVTISLSSRTAGARCEARKKRKWQANPLLAGVRAAKSWGTVPTGVAVTASQAFTPSGEKGAPSTPVWAGWVSKMNPTSCQSICSWLLDQFKSEHFQQRIRIEVDSFRSKFRG